MTTTTTALDAALARNSRFASVAELVADMTATGYTPTLRADLDPELLAVAAALEAPCAALGRFPLVYFLTAAGPLASCFGHPAAALARAESSTSKGARMIARDLRAALATPAVDPALLLRAVTLGQAAMGAVLGETARRAVVVALPSIDDVSAAVAAAVLAGQQAIGTPQALPVRLRTVRAVLRGE